MGTIREAGISRFDIFVQKLVSERNQRTSQVNELRDVAVELINRSGKHEQSVELQLTAFNQRWQDVDTRIKVSTQNSLDISIAVPHIH